MFQLDSLINLNKYKRNHKTNHWCLPMLISQMFIISWEAAAILIIKVSFTQLLPHRKIIPIVLRENRLNQKAINKITINITSSYNKCRDKINLQN